MGRKTNRRNLPRVDHDVTTDSTKTLQPTRLKVTDDWRAPFPVSFTEIDIVESFFLLAMDELILAGRHSAKAPKRFQILRKPQHTPPKGRKP